MSIQILVKLNASELMGSYIAGKTYCLRYHGFIQMLVKLNASELMGSYRYW